MKLTLNSVSKIGGYVNETIYHSREAFYLTGEAK